MYIIVYIYIYVKFVVSTLSELENHLSPKASMPEKPARRQTAPPNLPHLQTKHRTPNESTRSHGLRISLQVASSDTTNSG